MVTVTPFVTVTNLSVYREVFQEKASYNSKEFNVPVNILLFQRRRFRKQHRKALVQRSRVSRVRGMKREN